MHFIPLLRLGCNDQVQRAGIDSCEMGEFAYDYVGLEPELGPRHEFSEVGATGGAREPIHKKPSSEHTSSDEKVQIAQKTVQSA